MSIKPELGQPQPQPQPQPHPQPHQVGPPDLLSVESESRNRWLAQTSASLEEKLQAETDSRREERFYWILALAVLLDPYIFNELGKSWVPFAFIMLIEVTGLIALASRLGVERASLFLEHIFYRISLGTRSATPTADPGETRASTLDPP